jgi:hypothetical protein
MNPNIFDFSAHAGSDVGHRKLQRTDGTTDLPTEPQPAQNSAAVASSCPPTRPAQKIPKIDLTILIFLVAFAVHLAASHFLFGSAKAEGAHGRDLKAQAGSAVR